MANSLNLSEIDQEQALNLSRFFIKSNNNIFLFGRRGVGKTHIGMQAAKECGFKINYVNLSVVERPDLAGYPNLQDQSDVVTYKSPYFLPTLKEGQKPDSIILFDEVDKAPHEVTSPLLEILQFKKINGKPINVAGCILTGNLAHEGAYSNMVSTALLDRGAKYILKFNFDKWMDWAKLNGVHDLILGFLASDPEMACGAEESLHFASPSPRGWTLASDALYRARQFKMIDLETVTAVISGFVGDEAGMKFGIWYKYYREFEPKILSLLENGEYPIDFDKLSITEIYVWCVTTCHLAKRKIVETKGKAKQIQYAENVVKFFNRYNIDKEVQLVTMRNSFSFDFITKYKLYESPLFFDKSKSLQDQAVFKK